MVSYWLLLWRWIESLLDSLIFDEKKWLTTIYITLQIYHDILGKDVVTLGLS